MKNELERTLILKVQDTGSGKKPEILIKANKPN